VFDICVLSHQWRTSDSPPGSVWCLG